MAAHKGHVKAGGRKAGTPNKITTSIKEAFKQAFDEMGGVEALVNWGKANDTEFYKLASKLIPQDIKADLTSGGQPLQAIVNVTVSPKP